MLHPILEFELPSLEATQALAAQLGSVVEPPLTIALVGTLGAGKTQWVRFLVDSLGGSAELVTSPTYVLQQTYVGRWPIHHFDFYRLQSDAQVWDLGIEELFEQRCLVVIEWADKFMQCLPDDCLKIELRETASLGRTAQLTASGPHAAQLLRKL